MKKEYQFSFLLQTFHFGLERPELKCKGKRKIQTKETKIKRFNFILDNVAFEISRLSPRLDSQLV
jgi:hypothetical protein